MSKSVLAIDSAAAVFTALLGQFTLLNFGHCVGRRGGVVRSLFVWKGEMLKCVRMIEIR